MLASLDASQLTLIGVVAALTVACFVRSFLGFGDALVAMPILSLLIGVREAAPIVALMSFVTALFIVGSEWNNVDWKAAGWLIGSSLLGVPIGIYALRNAPEQYVQLFLAAIILGFCSLNWLRGKFTTLKDDRSIAVFGLIAGVLVGAYNTPGPPLVIYGTMRLWPPERFRANLQAYFLPTSLIVGLAHVTTGEGHDQIWYRMGIALPFTLLAVFLGSYLSRRVQRELFQRFIMVALLIVALMLVVDAL